MTWRTDFPPTEGQFLLAWKSSEDELFPSYTIAEMTQVDDYGDEENPLPIYIPNDAQTGEEIEFYGRTQFAWAEIETPVLCAWKDHIAEPRF